MPRSAEDEAKWNELLDKFESGQMTSEEIVGKAHEMFSGETLDEILEEIEEMTADDEA